MDTALFASAYTVCPFDVTDFPDLRLAHRARTITADLLHSRLRVAPGAPAARKGLDRFLHNDRLPPAPLLTASRRTGVAALAAAPLILCAEDTTLARANDGVPPADAGPLRHGWDLGYVVHAAVAIAPDTGLPCAWLGGDVWTRGDHAPRCQDHKTRALADRESRKWAALRVAIHDAFADAGFRGRIIHLNDREGDCWASLHDAVAAGHEVVTRATQNRRLVGERRKLRQHLAHQRAVACVPLTLHVRRGRGATTRVAHVEVRWARVTLAPPGRLPADQRVPLTVTALALYEVRPPRGHRRFTSVLLTTCAVAETAAALEVVRWYGQRWGVEVANDVLKSGLELEGIGVADVAAFTRLVAVMGPVATEIARWVAAARQPTPPPVGEVLDRATLRALGVACAFHGVRPPATWTLPTVVETLARLGGADVRPDRAPGWRTVWRGWKRFDEFRRIRSFRLDDDPDEVAPTAKHRRKAARSP